MAEFTVTTNAAKKWLHHQWKWLYDAVDMLKEEIADEKCFGKDAARIAKRVPSGYIEATLYSDDVLDVRFWNKKQRCFKHHPNIAQFFADLLPLWNDIDASEKC